MTNVIIFTTPPLSKTDSSLSMNQLLYVGGKTPVGSICFVTQGTVLRRGRTPVYVL